MYLVLLERKYDLRPLVRKDKKERGMLGNFSVFESTHDQNASGETTPC